jgi:hypothetical protein
MRENGLKVRGTLCHFTFIPLLICCVLYGVDRVELKYKQVSVTVPIVELKSDKGKGKVVPLL